MRIQKGEKAAPHPYQVLDWGLVALRFICLPNTWSIFEICMKHSVGMERGSTLARKLHCTCQQELSHSGDNKCFIFPTPRLRLH